MFGSEDQMISKYKFDKHHFLFQMMLNGYVIICCFNILFCINGLRCKCPTLHASCLIPFSISSSVQLIYVLPALYCSDFTFVLLLFQWLIWPVCTVPVEINEMRWHVSFWPVSCTR